VSGHGEKRTRQEEQAISALLACPTIEAAAEKVGIAPATLRRWLTDPAFQQRYRAARRQVVEQAIAQLQRGTSEAVTALRRNLQCGVPAAEIAAAKAVMDYSVKAIELVDLVERVEQLEQAASATSEREKGSRR
jgi:hypothetical protein